MEYSNSFIRYERRGARVVPVRVTKSWVEPPDQRAAPGKQKVLKSAQVGRQFIATRVTELKMRDVRGDREAAPEEWTSFGDRVESRARLLTLVTKYKLEDGGEPILTPVGAGLPVLELGSGPLTMDQARAQFDPEPESREWWMWRQWAESRGYDTDEAEAA